MDSTRRFRLAAAALALGLLSPALAATDQDRCTCLVHTMGDRLQCVIDQVSDETPSPAATRSRLLLRMQLTNQCLRPDLTDEQIADVLRRWRELPDSVLRHQAEQFDLRFNVAEDTYVGPGNLGPSGKAAAAALTYSFVPDVMVWGQGSDAGAVGEGNLLRKFIATWGAGSVDRGRELVRLGFAAWGKWCNLTHTEVTDDASPWSTSTVPPTFTGLTRIGGATVVNPMFVAYNAFPINGSDMLIETTSFASFWANPANDYRVFRNTIVHEHGHGLGMIHQVPCNGTKIMEPFINAGFDSLSIDDIRGGQRNFGDRFSGNHSWPAAASLGDITAGAGRSIRELLLSTNGALTPANPAGADWFRIESSIPGRLLTVRVKPRGGSFSTGPQMAVGSNLCAGQFVTVNAQQAGNLRLEYYIDPESFPTFVSAEGGPGVDEQIILVIGTGARYIRVVDDGPNLTADQFVQLYDLEIIIDAVPSDPMAVLGINKIAYVDQACWLSAGTLSQPTEPGATLTLFEYDTDGDLVADASGPSTSVVFSTPGLRTVTAYVHDSNGRIATDSITVDVRSPDTIDGATQIFPNSTVAGTTVGATADAPQGCGALDDVGVWYLYIPRATGLHNIFVCPSSPGLNPVLSLSSGPYHNPTLLTCSGSNPGFCSLDPQAAGISQALLSANQPYYIKVATSPSQTGPFSISVVESRPVGRCCAANGFCAVTDDFNCGGGGTWSSGVCLPNSCVPANDLCSNPTVLTLNQPVAGSTGGVSNADGDSTFSCTFDNGRGVWFTFTPNASTRYQISSCGTEFYNVLTIFEDEDCVGLVPKACAYAGGPGTCSGSFIPARIRSVQLTSGLTHRILLTGGYSGSNPTDTYFAGDYQLVVRCFADFNQSGSVTVQDIFDFLAAYFSNNLDADANGSDALSVQDIFDFLNVYFVGC